MCNYYIELWCLYICDLFSPPTERRYPAIEKLSHIPYHKIESTSDSDYDFCFEENDT